jgi:hypothetical protein
MLSIRKYDWKLSLAATILKQQNPGGRIRVRKRRAVWI